MINLIRMNLYRFFREKGYISLIIIMLCAAFISAIVVEISTDPAVEVTQTVDENGQAIYNVQKGNGTENVSITTTSEPSVSIAEIFVEVVGFGVIIMVSGIFAIIYSDTERRYGFVKNLTVRKRERVAVFAAKTVPVFLFTLFSMLAILGGIYLGSLLVSPIAFGDISQFISYFMVQLLVATAFGIFSLALYELLRKEVAVVITVIFTALGLLAKIVQLLEMGLVKIGIFSEAFFEKYEITQHFLATRSSGITLSDVKAGSPCTVIVAIAGILVYTAAGMILYRKKDVV